MILSLVPVKAKPLLSLLNLSAVFILLIMGFGKELFQCGTRDSALALLKSCLQDQYQQIIMAIAVSESSLLHCGVPQDSVLVAALFLVYTHSLALLLAFEGVDGHFYADDRQIYLPIANIDETYGLFILALMSVLVGVKSSLSDCSLFAAASTTTLKTLVTDDFYGNAHQCKSVGNLHSLR